MAISRHMKLKSWAGLFLMMLVFLFTIHSTIPKHTIQLEAEKQISFNRLSTTHQQVLNSALAHIRLGYVANKTPHYSTPPLLVLYSFHHQQDMTKNLDDRLLDITSAYFFSMLQPGSAFAYDMDWPVKFEWFFSSLPEYMSMNTDQANFYKERTQAHEIMHHLERMTEEELSNKNFAEEYKNTKIISTSDWPSTGWMSLRENGYMKATRDQYRLNHLSQKSDWFWLTSRLLFSRPTGWFSQQLEPYRDMMGGKLEYSENLSPWNPESYKVTPEFAAKQWLRIGLRVTLESQCLVNHVVNLCKQTNKKCHVFVSASHRDLLKTARNQMKSHRIAVHAVAEGFGFADLNEEPENNLDHSIFDTDENRLKRDYARTFMDWIILSRMDYLVGQEEDGFLKTAAWAAQVQTDILIKNMTECHIIPMSDW
ncbi:uncharacterized protein EV154DRAFT_498317 [Mucor mucedo]|uniref:uncharacterized protein n=1 Tax=Mucor mucedo TaxID=29922 RepID=UPI00221F3A35|nr:uncharacterized protein EV154DRAFT_498317 [Mucor mucedo]KAI7894611.1 hypothetical protein EV154DRAFT_498317 [Mucor mucedo]